jgi:hypothetical protein
MGAKILDGLLSQAGQRALRLNATRDARKLYRSRGFSETGRLVQYQGVAKALVKPTANARTIDPVADLEGLLTLDAATFGVRRDDVFQGILNTSQGWVIEQDNVISAFALCRRFGRGWLIGPLCAPDSDQAIALVDHILADKSGEFVRLDADERHTDLGHALTARNLMVYDHGYPMILQGGFGPEDAPNTVYALASQALG